MRWRRVVTCSAFMAATMTCAEPKPSNDSNGSIPEPIATGATDAGSRGERTAQLRARTGRWKATYAVLREDLQTRVPPVVMALDKFSEALDTHLDGVEGAASEAEFSRRARAMEPVLVGAQEMLDRYR